MAKDFDPNIGKATQFSSGEEAAENGRKGGNARSRKLKERKTLRELVEAFGDLDVSSKTRSQMKELQIPDELIMRKMQPVVALYNKANKGDVAAFNAIRDIIGEKPVDETKVTGSVQTDISIELIDSGSKPVEDESAIDLRRQQEEQLP